MKKEIQMINLELLKEHPDNPRKDVGDVSELADSIRESGILQNLTVVPYEGEYRVIIGHRRLAAAKRAGLTQAPCIVADMDYKTQLATMLSENMQRVDLNIVEQAFGIQQLFDLGVGIEEVKQKTGFSEVTIKKRTKIATLPIDKAKDALSRGATLEEYLKCCEIENKNDREILLANAGTRDFQYRYTSAIHKQDTKKYHTGLVKKLENLGFKAISRQESWQSCYAREGYFYSYRKEDRDKIENFKPSKNKTYVFSEEKGDGVINIYEKIKVKSKTKNSSNEIEANNRRKELKALSATFYEMRKAFVFGYVITAADERIIRDFLLESLAKKMTKYGDNHMKIIKEACGDNSEDYYPDEEKLSTWLKKAKNKELIFAYYYTCDGTDYINPYTANYGETMPVYKRNERTEALYSFLEKLGYKISTEEEAFLTGTHELFK